MNSPRSPRRSPRERSRVGYGFGHDKLPRVQLLSAIFWPSFVFAGLGTIAFFAVFDPVRILQCEAAPPLGRTAAYSIGFFAFWALTICVSMATTYYLRPIDEVPGDATQLDP